APLRHALPGLGAIALVSRCGSVACRRTGSYPWCGLVARWCDLVGCRCERAFCWCWCFVTTERGLDVLLHHAAAGAGPLHGAEIHVVSAGHAACCRRRARLFGRGRERRWWLGGSRCRSALRGRAVAARGR